MNQMITWLKKRIYHPVKNILAKYYLIFLKSFTGIKVIAITGSAGKTTTKEMTASILRRAASTVWSKDNIDPVYNIPATILRCTPATKYLVLEMGIEYPGEMDFYLGLVKPDVAVITNIFPTHTEFLGSVEGVFREKSKLVLSLDKDSYAVLNRKDAKLKSLPERLRAKVVWFEGGNMDAARAVGNIFGVGRKDMEAGLKNFDRLGHRLRVIRLISGATLLDDSYNSNPEALLATLREFNKMAGDMLELGKLEESEHRRVGREVVKSDFDAVIGVGKAVKFLIDEVKKGSGKTETYLFRDQTSVLPALKPLAVKDSFILIKGSRSIGLDKVVDALV